MAMEIELVLDVSDLDRMAEFYAAALGYRPEGSIGQYRSIVPAEGPGRPKLILQRVDEPKRAKNRMHIDLKADDIEAEADRLVALGATRQHRIEEDAGTWLVMADPEGNEFCVQ